MATYISNKSNAFRGIDNPNAQNVPQRRRSESRLKRYTSVTDARAWTHYTKDAKSYIIGMMGQEQEPCKPPKVVGQYIPAETLWKIVLHKKNEYICELEEQLNCFVFLFHSINLSATQWTKLKELRTSSLQNIEEYLFNSKDVLIGDREDEKSVHVQAKPKMMAAISETDIVTHSKSVAVKTVDAQTCDTASNTDMQPPTLTIDTSNATIARCVSHVSTQVVLAPRKMLDKCISVRVRSTPKIPIKNKSETGPISEITFGPLKLSTFASIKHVPDLMGKSQSSIGFTPKLRQSCVTFMQATSENQPVVAPPKRSSGDDTEDMDSFATAPATPKQSSCEIVEVMSECEQTGFTCGRRSSVIQLYKATKKSSIESYQDLQGSQLFDKQEAVDEDGATKPPTNNANDLVEMQDCPAHLGNDPKVQGPQNDKSTNIISCIKSKKSKKPKPRADSNEDEECWEKLKRKESEVKKHKAYAMRALWQLELIRQTLAENADTVICLNVETIQSKMADVEKCADDVALLERDLQAVCKDGGSKACKVLNEQLKVIKQYCRELADGEEENARLQEENRRLKNAGPGSKSPNLAPVTMPTVEITSAGGRSSKENFREGKQMEYYKSKMIKLEQLNLERNILRESVLKLEAELKMYEGIKSEFSLSASEVDSECPLTQIEDIQEQIAELKQKAAQVDTIQKQLDAERSLKDQLRDSFAKLSASKMNECESLRYKAQEAEILRLERDRLKLKMTECEIIQAENINLHNKCAELEKSGARPVQVDQDCGCDPDGAPSEEIQKLQKEKDGLMFTLIARECALADQEDQIDRLVMHVDRLMTSNELQQEKSKRLVSSLRTELDAKSDYIANMDNELESMEEKLKHSISSISKDSSNLQNKLARMECCCTRQKGKLDGMQETIDSLKAQLAMQEELNKNYSLELQKKGKLLEDMQTERTAQDEQLQNVNRMESMLKKSHNAVRRVVDELAKQYRCDLKDLKQIVVPEMMNN